jgi:hypothetical protein
MNLQTLITDLQLKTYTQTADLENIIPSGGYASDLLSCVMAGAKPGNLWVTVQSHLNIVAVAALTECCAILISEAAEPDAEVIARANEQGVPLLGSSQGSYQLVAALSQRGIN